MQKLNWLYPKFLGRIDHHLKINHPHIWRTRVHDFAWFSLILGNVTAVALGMLMVGYNNVPSESSVSVMHTGLMVLLVFVGLFWAMRLLRYKMKFSNFKMMLTTWVIYVLCIVSLGLNLATFVSSVAYRTASLYADKTAQEHEDYLSYGMKKGEGDLYYYDGEKYHLAMIGGDFSTESCYDLGILKDDCRTDKLLKIISLHGYPVNANSLIVGSQITEIKYRLGRVQEAKKFAQRPIILGKNYVSRSERTSYHNLLDMQWTIWITILFFLPSLLFLVSAFGLRNVLISGLCAALIVGASVFIDITFPTYSISKNMLPFNMFAVFILGMILVLGRQRLMSWNYIAGVFMLTLGAVFFMFLETSPSPIGLLSPGLGVLCVSLTASLIAAWMISRHNQEPVLH